MTYPTLQQLHNVARAVANAERIHVENKVLKLNLKLSDDELAQVSALAEVALKTGAPDRFLSAVAAMASKPLFVPCGCWWCKLKRVWAGMWHR